MAFLDELMGATAAPGAGPDLKQFLGPIMEAMATESRRAADPISRIGDVGSAVLGTVGSGIPYGQGLAALDKQRSDTIKGSAQLFLSMLGQERQLEQLKQEGAYRNEQLRLSRERMELDASQFRTTSGQTERRLTNEEKRIENEDKRLGIAGKRESRTAFLSTYKASIGDAGKDLTPEAKGALEQALSKDDLYRRAWEGDDAKLAKERFDYHYNLIRSNPKNVVVNPEQQRFKAEQNLLTRASQTVDSVSKKLIAGDGRVNRDLLTALDYNLPWTEGKGLRNDLKMALTDYVFARSGKQVAVAELDRWMDIYIPRLTDDDATVKQKIKNLSQNLETLGRDTPANTPAASPASPGAPKTPSGITVKRTGSMMVGGKNVKVYEGSDGGIYDFDGRKIK